MLNDAHGVKGWGYTPATGIWIIDCFCNHTIYAKSKDEVEKRFKGHMSHPKHVNE